MADGADYVFVADDFTGASDTLATLARCGVRATGRHGCWCAWCGCGEAWRALARCRGAACHDTARASRVWAVCVCVCVCVSVCERTHMCVRAR